MADQRLAGLFAEAGDDVDCTGRETGRGRDLGKAQGGEGRLLGRRFSTAVQPAASAGASERAAMPSGKFQGTMCAVTPKGSRSVKSTKPGPSGIVAPSILSAAPAL
jgi:hypothetical protein